MKYTWKHPPVPTQIDAAQEVSKVLALLALYNRRRILAVLRDGAQTLTSITDTLSFSAPYICGHLKYMEELGMVRTRSDDRWRYKALTDSTSVRIDGGILRIEVRTRLGGHIVLSHSIHSGILAQLGINPPDPEPKSTTASAGRIPVNVAREMDNILHTLLRWNRRRMLAMLRDGPRNVTTISRSLGLLMSYVSAHLSDMEDLGLVCTRRRKTCQYKYLTEHISVRVNEAVLQMEVRSPHNAHVMVSHPLSAEAQRELGVECRLP